MGRILLDEKSRFIGVPRLMGTGRRLRTTDTPHRRNDVDWSMTNNAPLRQDERLVLRLEFAPLAGPDVPGQKDLHETNAESES